MRSGSGVRFRVEVTVRVRLGSGLSINGGPWDGLLGGYLKLNMKLWRGEGKDVEGRGALLPLPITVGPCALVGSGCAAVCVGAVTESWLLVPSHDSREEQGRRSSGERAEAGGGSTGAAGRL